ncbi:hypothetical protein BHE74_00035173 [Ensete ventricosum]|nr:hypothetical protein BHE74_00035173 [Ensete ventricosum]
MGGRQRWRRKGDGDQQQEQGTEEGLATAEGRKGSVTVGEFETQRETKGSTTDRLRQRETEAARLGAVGDRWALKWIEDSGHNRGWQVAMTLLCGSGLQP